MESRRLSPGEALAYWDVRHSRLDDLLSGGDRSFDRASNEAFYAWRLGRLLGVLGDLNGGLAPLFLLDAGCGKGWFARALARCGHVVDAIDTSAIAIEAGRRIGGGPRYAQSALSAWRSPWLYDFVYAVDVMFHILDDVEWAASVRNLASLVRLGGTLVITDWLNGSDLVVSDYMVVRPPSAYRALLKQAFREHHPIPYNFRGSPAGFLVYSRMC